MFLTRRAVITGLLAATAFPLPVLADDLPRNVERLDGAQLRTVIVGKEIRLGFRGGIEVRADGTYYSDYGRPQLPILRGTWTISKDGTFKTKPKGGGPLGSWFFSRKNGKYLGSRTDGAVKASPIF